MTQEEFHKRYQYNPNTDCLGEGGFGKVYKAYDTHRDRYVAIKMAEVKPHLEEVRLKKEVEIISKLPTHPNIAYYEECYTFSTFAGEYDFGVLQYYEEGNLQQLLTDKQLSYEQKDSLLRQILEGIVFLHSEGIIHRDLKPQNILISDRNGEYIPKITDFGISKKLDVNKSSYFTNSLAGAGTLSFASPEQLMGNTIRKNTDLWSFGVIAFWAFAGNLPFNTGMQTVTSEAGRIELFRQITKGELTFRTNQFSSDWHELIKNCIVVNIEARISSASQCLMFLGKEYIRTNETGLNSETNGTILLKFKKISLKYRYDYLYSFKEEMACVIRDNKYGFINKNGDEIVQCNYDDWNYFKQGLAIVKRHGKYGLVNKEGRNVVDCKYDFATNFSEGLALVRRNWKYGFINKDGLEVIQCVYDDASSFSEGIASVKLGNKGLFINSNGEIVLSHKYKTAASFQDGVSMVSRSGFLSEKVGYINKKGQEVIPCQFDDSYGFSENLAIVMNEQKVLSYRKRRVGIINKSGTFVIAQIYDSILKFNEGLAFAERGLEWDSSQDSWNATNAEQEFINKEGRVILSSSFLKSKGYFVSGVNCFSEGLLVVKKNQKTGYIDTSGVEIISCKYDDCSDFTEGFAKVKKHGKYGFVNHSGEEIISCIYDEVNNFSEGLASVRLNKEMFYIDQTGEQVSFYK